LAPGLGDLDVALLEDHLAALAADARGAQLPLDPAVAVVSGAREATLDLDAGSGLARAPGGGCVLGRPGRECGCGGPIAIAVAADAICCVVDNLWTTIASATAHQDLATFSTCGYQP